MAAAHSEVSSLVAQKVKNLPAMWEIWVQSLGWEDPLEEGMITHSSILAWRIPMDREAWQAIVHGVTGLSDFHFHLLSVILPCFVFLLNTNFITIIYVIILIIYTPP